MESPSRNSDSPGNRGHRNPTSTLLIVEEKEKTSFSTVYSRPSTPGVTSPTPSTSGWYRRRTTWTTCRTTTYHVGPSGKPRNPAGKTGRRRHATTSHVKSTLGNRTVHVSLRVVGTPFEEPTNSFRFSRTGGSSRLDFHTSSLTSLYVRRQNWTDEKSVYL